MHTGNNGGGGGGDDVQPRGGRGGGGGALRSRSTTTNAGGALVPMAPTIMQLAPISLGAPPPRPRAVPAATPARAEASPRQGGDDDSRGDDWATTSAPAPPPLLEEGTMTSKKGAEGAFSWQTFSFTSLVEKALFSPATPTTSYDRGVNSGSSSSSSSSSATTAAAAAADAPPAASRETAAAASCDLFGNIQQCSRLVVNACGGGGGVGSSNSSSSSRKAVNGYIKTAVITLLTAATVAMGLVAGAVHVESQLTRKLETTLEPI
jgi:hypothetical protein